MKTTFRKSMIWLHTYTGLLGGWLLFAVFLTGTLSYYNQEITQWMNHEKVSQHDQWTLLSHSVTVLEKEALQAKSWQIQLPDDRGNKFSVSYRLNGKRKSMEFDANELTEKDKSISRGGDFFRTFHYTLSLRNWGGRYYTGIAAMLMLIGVFTGIYTHRRFFKDFFTIRSGVWKKFLTDFHAVAGVITIPFCFVISFSALLIYINMYQPFAIDRYFESYRALDREVSTLHQTTKEHGEKAALSLNWQLFRSQLQAQWGEFKLSSVTINHPRDTNAQLIFVKDKANSLSNKADSVAFNKYAEMQSPIASERLARNVRRIFYGLHEAHFAEPLLRASLFILGMVSTLMISTGMIIWLAKRAVKQTKSSYNIVERINHGMFYGLSLSVGLYLACGKLNYFGLTVSHHDQIVFFMTWLISLIGCIILQSNLAKRFLLLANLAAYSGLLLLDVVAVSMDGQMNIAHATVTFWLTIAVLFFSYLYKAEQPVETSKEYKYA